MNTNYEIIALDLDGTLLDDKKQLTPRTEAAVNAVIRAGKRVILATGRPPNGVMPTADRFRLRENGGFILSFNGGMITDCRTGEILYRCPIPQEYNTLLAETAEREQVAIMTYSERGDCIYASAADDPRIAIVARNNRMRVYPVNMRTHNDFPSQKFLMLAEESHLARVEERMRETWKGKLSIYRSEPFILEIVPDGIDKSVSLRHLLERLSLTPDRLIAFGDGYNDAGMLTFVGLGVAMENAVPPTKAAADLVTASNNNDGVALVLEKYILGHGL